MIVTIGIGCKRDAPPGEVLDLVRAALAEMGLSQSAVACVATIDRKNGEAAIGEVAAALGVSARFFPAEDLASETRIATGSARVASAVDTSSVAEAAALRAAGPGATLILPKRKSAQATCAIAINEKAP